MIPTRRPRQRRTSCGSCRRSGGSARRSARLPRRRSSSSAPPPPPPPRFLSSGGPPRREPLYAPANSFPVRTRIGCAMQCAYCLTANLGGRHENGALEIVLDELEQTVATGVER